MRRAGEAGRVGLRAALVGLCLLAALFLASPQARAHGGQFRGPGAPPPTGPGLGPIPLPTVITPGDTWQTWWDLNRLGLIPGRDIALRRQVVTPGDDQGASLEEGWSRRRALAARKTVVPFLLRLVDRQKKHRNEVVGAALIALGKVSQDKIVIPIFLDWLKDPQADQVVRESAALGLGLLRRTQPSLQLDGATLDSLRDELLLAVDDERAHVRIRAFAALAIGLLGDQPFGTAWSKDGRLVIRALWKRLERAPDDIDVPVAVLVALGMQPRAGCPDAVREGLHHIVNGKTLNKRRFQSLERSHALTALIRLGDPSVHALALRILRRTREDEMLKRAVYLAVGRWSRRMTGPERREMAMAIETSLKSRRDPLTTGLGHIAAGRLLEQDLREGEITVLDAAELPHVLLEAAKKGPSTERGFAAIALALAARGAKDAGGALPLQQRVQAMLLHGLEKGRGDDALKASYAVALGVLDVPEGIDLLLETVRDVHANPVLRGHAAVALGQMGRRAKDIRPALMTMLAEKRGVTLRVRAAMALALLGGRDVRDQLIGELGDASSEYHRAHVVIALGRLGDLGAVQPLLEYATNERYSELARALGVVALGLLTDPETRPSMLRLTEDANYPAATSVLYSAYSIF
jgi:HEAT repeat protein